MTKERKVQRSITFTINQLDKLEKLQEKEHVSIAEHVGLR